MALIYNHAWNIKNYRYIGDVSHVRRDADHDVSWQEAATMTPVRSSLMRDRAGDGGVTPALTDAVVEETYRSHIHLAYSPELPLVDLPEHKHDECRDVRDALEAT